MNNSTAAVTLALATAFGATAAEAHGDHHRYHRGPNIPGITVIIPAPPMYVRPAPQSYYSTPYYAPAPNRYQRSCIDTPYGSQRITSDIYSGRKRITDSFAPCPVPRGPY